MARRMVAVADQLVSFEDEFRVLVSTEQQAAELWTWTVPHGDLATSPQYVRAHDVPPGQTDVEFTIPTPDLGSVTRIRLFAGRTGSPNGDGSVIGDLVVPRLDQGARTTCLTDCTEGSPQVEMATGGTWVRGLLGSGAVETAGLVAVGGAPPVWPEGWPFPVFPDAGHLFSAVSGPPGLVHQVLAVDPRSDGWPTGPGLDPGSSVWFVALVWDSSGGWDFTWDTQVQMPTRPGPYTPSPEELQTRERRVDLHVDALVCLDDSDDLSDGEATFTLAVRSDGAPDQVRTVAWDPMATGTTKALDELFTVVGPGAPRLAVLALEDDGRSPFGDDDDSAVATPLTLSYPRGPAAESYVREATVDAGPGGDGFRFQVHVRAAVSYT